ncbi:hypothetical protein BD324DRAFT_620885 [Kockovaella imperatae]|uniref:Uncharacterized protein n=1 Tax=Kockovaella imperatae TaxID=4999 RepID=A0A1Y1UKD8_9TREE|nr:hypothetical protein BD324DRAFT_620885 [Kockovaella imperatae]ORX38442.1 hypothetical protein BD324DRAFT_620885 [Kockovaella imperatae]
MASTWEVISSAFTLLAFLGIVCEWSIHFPSFASTGSELSHKDASILFADLGLKVKSALTSTTESTKKDLSSKGVTYSNGRLSVRTDRAAPSREEYLANTRAAFEAGAKTMSLHPEAFKTGASRTSSSENNESAASSTAVSPDSSEKKGFRRTKKLA